MTWAITLGAIKCYDEAIRLNTGVAMAWNNKGGVLYDLGDYTEAIKLNPQLTEAWSNKGVALEALHRYADADAAFDEARALEIG